MVTGGRRSWKCSAVRRLLFAGLVLTVTGCAQPAAPAAPAAPAPLWPQQWRGRRLAETPQAWLFASSDAAGAEVDELAREVLAELARDTGAAPPRGLLIVTDVDDELVVDDPAGLLALARAARGRREVGRAPNEEIIALQWRVMRQAMERAGVEPAEVLRAQITPLTAEEVAADLGLPRGTAESVPWAVALPVRAAVIHSTWATMRTAMDLKPPEDPDTYASYSPMMQIVVEGVAREALEAARLTLYQAAACALPGVDADARRAAVEAYEARLEAGPKPDNPPARPHGTALSPSP